MVAFVIVESARVLSDLQVIKRDGKNNSQPFTNLFIYSERYKDSPHEYLNSTQSRTLFILVCQVNMFISQVTTVFTSR